MPNTVKLVAQGAWQKEFDTHIGAIKSSVQKKLAISILVNLQSHHIGISPELAASLAESQLRPDTRGYADIWMLLVQRLQNALYLLSEQGLGSISEKSFLFREVMPYLITKLISPILVLASQRCKEGIVLLAHDETAPDEMSSEDYSAHCREIFRKLSEILTEDFRSAKPSFSLSFWQDRALTIYNLTAQDKDSSGKKALIPQNSLIDSAIFLNFDPEPRTRLDRQKNISIPSPNKLKDERLKDPGFDGVTRTSKISEIHHMLSSEYIYPDDVRYDRLFNSGYWIYKPVPLSIQPRDALVVSIAPYDITRLVHASFLKTCWFDFSIHLSSILHSHNLNQSEFQWIEGDSFFRTNVQHFLLEHLDENIQSLYHQHSRSFRQYYRKMLQWLPNFLDRHSRFHGSSESTDVQTTDIEKWLEHLDSPSYKPASKGASKMGQDDYILHNFGDQDTSLNRFRFRQIMLFLPRSQRKKYPTDARAALSQILKINGHRFARNEISILWVPEKINLAQYWAYEGEIAMSNAWYNTDGTVNIDLLAVDLVDVWLQEVLRKMSYA